VSVSLDAIRFQIEASIATKQVLLRDTALLEQVETLAKTMVQCLKQGGKVIFAGNGGSFADAQHLSAEFVSRFMFDRAALASVVLGANSSTISAIGNDYGYSQVFARELEGIAKAGDVFIPISTSGNSPNILSAVERANELGLIILAFTGASGGKLAFLCSCLCIPSTNTTRIQECHIMLGHIVCSIVEESIFFKGEK
jgi:D-sedoheptulose 7-phosphate isomerase